MGTGSTCDANNFSIQFLFHIGEGESANNAAKHEDRAPRVDRQTSKYDQHSSHSEGKPTGRVVYFGSSRTFLWITKAKQSTQIGLTLRRSLRITDRSVHIP